jgi:hypothetical protein
MTRLVALTERTDADRWAEVRDEEALWGDLRPELLAAVRTVLETTMESELWERLQAERYKRTACRRSYRNGYYRRGLVTELGLVDELRIPRARAFAYRPSFLARAARRTGVVDDVLRQAFLRGLSTRETAALATSLTGISLSAAAVSRLGRALDGQVAAFHRRPIAFPARYLLLDGLWLSVRANGRAAKRVVLACYGIDQAGRRELLDYGQATSESSVAWRRLLGSLIRRGLDPEAIELVTADGAGGIAAAVDEAFPRAALQRCWTHRAQNILEALPLRERRACLVGCDGSTGHAPDGPPCRPTGAGHRPGGRATPGSCGPSSMTSTSSSPCSRCPRSSGRACARRTYWNGPSGSCAGGSARSARSPTGAPPTGSSTARCSASTSSWPDARSLYFHRDLMWPTGPVGLP